MPLNIVRNDIVKMDVDAVVITSTAIPSIGDGVDAAINKAAGDKLFKERQQFGNVEIGKSIVTKAYNLKAKYVIHTFAPKWSSNTDYDLELLKSCYKSILNNALALKIDSLAIPLIGTVFYSIPLDITLSTATEVITNFLNKHDLSVYLVVYDTESFKEVSKKYQYIKEYIDDNYIDTNTIKSRRVEIDHAYDTFESLQAPTLQSESNQSLEEYLESLDEGFSSTLLKLIDRSGHDDAYVYKKANIDRKLFSKIRTNKDYKPSKQTALAFAIALELDLDQTLDLLGRAGFTMSPSSRFDLIVEFHIKNSIYNIYTINEALFAFDQPLLGQS